MYLCPLCENTVQDFELACPRCDSDLQLLAKLNELPDLQFNLARQAAELGNWPRAASLLGALLSARMGDFEAWLLLGTLYARRGLWQLARESLDMVLLFHPGETRAIVLRATIDRIEISQKSDSSEE